jgi:tRNA (guanine26-N2/guanine27-N2)-dimethyltransferase
LQRKEERKEKFRPLRFLDALTASGLRLFRVAKEMPSSLIESSSGCDLSEYSRDIFNINLHLNNLQTATNINFNLTDANQFMSSAPLDKKFDIIDLDPYGSMVPFLDATLTATSKNALLCLTSTDTRVLCGSDRHKCFYMYGAVRGGTDFIEETGLRIAMATIQRIANTKGKAVEPLLCVQSDFYVRLFVRVVKSKQKCWQAMNTTGMQYYCKSCGNQHVQGFGETHKTDVKKTAPKKFELASANCEICGGKFSQNGPLYTGKLYDEGFVQKMLEMLGFLEEANFEEFSVCIWMLLLFRFILCFVLLFFMKINVKGKNVFKQR